MKIEENSHRYQDQMIDLTRLKAFIFSAETLSFSEASKYLHLTQPTVSHHIKTLETELGVALFHRNGNRLELTEAGNMLVPWARKLIRQSNEIKDMMVSVKKDATGSLRIACSSASGKYVLPHLAARFRNRFPGVQVSILPCAPKNIMTRLLDEEAHLAIISSEVVDQNMESQTLYIDTIKLIAPIEHPWIKREKILTTDLMDEKLIMREPSSGTRQVVLSEFSKHDIAYDDLNIFLELGNAEGIVQAVSAGYGISFVSNLIAKQAIKSKEISMVEIEDWDLHRRVFMVRKSFQAPNRVTEAFWSFVHDPSNKDLLPNPFNHGEDHPI
jgi:DNA-binding transcriptional LysR family regulator